jgi:hypothetical protein
MRETRAGAEQYYVINVAQQLADVLLTVQQFRPVTEGSDSARNNVLARFEEFLAFAKSYRLVTEDNR